MTQVSSPQNISKRWLTAVFGRFVHVVPRSRNGTVVMTIIVITASVIMTTVRELVKVNATTSLWERRVPWAISQLQNGAITWERLIYATAPILPHRRDLPACHRAKFIQAFTLRQATCSKIVDSSQPLATFIVPARSSRRLKIEHC